ncbi:quinolinate synthase NadA [Alteribacter natronophilus]|uniref:quinolinate synthase NadA n=1 Tax=Alteribacter natronophilus TaxID=2583810 RepID=UPI00110D30F6|nr:quinolinate synthase NadA [Alteribacter natronophilus]TMW70269.1 quinolinate synthase NadA [Alteribacter natronophilus]
MSAIDLLMKNESMLPEVYKKMTDDELTAKISRVKKALGSDLYLPGHHYQKDDIIRFADAAGDSLKLAQLSAANKEARYVVFCGVHFMAETADILTEDHQEVILPDMRAGCSMADMADYRQTERAWEALTHQFGDTIIPITYVNSTAEIKAFVGRHGGACVTSSNARQIVTWALEQKKRILFLPDQHLGRNTAYELGIPLDEMLVWDPIAEELEESGAPEKCRVLLWKGHCSVHENFRMPHVEHLREKEPDRRILVHPECTWEVVQASDDAGSTSYIIDQIRNAPDGSRWAIGTEMNLVNRLIDTNPHLDIISLNPYMCPCLTMNRIDLPHLAWALDQVEAGKPVNTIRVPEKTASDAKKALERMLELV